MVIFLSHLDVAYYLPKDEDGEYYQMCYIDSAGKMRGASTPFQFLEQSADDFVQIIDDSMDILMIHNKVIWDSRN